VSIHPTAIIDSDARIGEGTHVGPYCIIEAGVRLGKNCTVQSHVVLRGDTEIGDEVKIFPFAVVGSEPQHLHYKGEPTKVVVEKRVVIRESVTIHRGTKGGTGITRVGENTLLMAYTHVAHDCTVGNNVIIANSVQLAGHVEIGDSVVIGGQSEIAQFCRIGKYCYVGGGSTLRKDLPPFLVGKGNEFEVQGINVVGMTRQGFSAEIVGKLKTLYKIFYMQKLTVNQALEKITIELPDCEEARSFCQFVKSSKAGIIR
jgi:UDP-N-acetylglucosamine acyltransferase